MATAGLVAETLSAWRKAERLLDGLPPGSPDHETARLLVMELHELFVELTEHKGESTERLASSMTTIRQARQLLSSLPGVR
jgi:hypothetical protein